MKKLLSTLLVLAFMSVPATFAAELSDDGSLMVEQGAPKNVSCLWYLPNYRYLLADWHGKVNETISHEIERILGR